MLLHLLIALVLMATPLGAFAQSRVMGEAANPQDKVLYNYRNSIKQQDDFMLGTTTAGSIGQNGWSSAGTVTQQSPVANRFGLFRFDTGAGAGTFARINTAGSTSFSSSGTSHSITWIIRLNTNDADTTIRIGASSDWTSSTPTSGIYFERLLTDTNWFCVTRATTETRVDTTIASDTSFHTFRHKKTGTSVMFFLDNVPVCGTMTATMPAAAMSIGAHIYNNAASAAKTFDVDYSEYEITGITR